MGQTTPAVISRDFVSQLVGPLWAQSYDDRMLRVLIALVVSLSLANCATILAEDQRTITVTTTPPGAQVTLNGMPAGVTPMNLVVNDHQDQNIMIQMQGYAPAACYLRTSVGVIWIVADIIFGGWPLVVDLITNDWASLDQNACHVPLVPMQG